MRPRPHFKRASKPHGGRFANRHDYECQTCGREPLQCVYCRAFTCGSCATSAPLCCMHCQRPFEN